MPEDAEPVRTSVEFDTLISDLSSRFINLPRDEVDLEIEDALGRVCEVLQVDSSVLWQSSPALPHAFTATHCYLRGGAQPPESMRQEQFPWVSEQILAGRMVRISSLDELPSEAAVDRRHAELFGIKSDLSLPISSGGAAPVACLAFNTIEAERDWPDALVNRLQLVAQVVGNAVARKHADESLRESEERLAMAAEAADAGLWILDYATGIFWATRRARLIFGLPQNEAITVERLQAAIHPEDRDRVRGAIERAARSPEQVEVEGRILSAEGEVRWVDCRARAHFTATGAPDRLMGLSIDVTDRKRGEEALHVSEARLQAGVDIAGLGFCEVDEGTGAVFADAGLRDIIGSPPDCEGMCIIQFWMEHMHPDDAARVIKERKEALEGKRGDLAVEYRYLHPVRGEIWIQQIGRPTFRDASGFAVRSFGVLRDITEQKRAAESLLASEARLQAGAELAGLAFFEVDYAAGTMFVDDRFRGLCGVPPGLEQGLRTLEFWTEHIHPDDAAHILDVCQEAFDGTLDHSIMEYRFLPPGQEQKWIRHVARVPARDASGRAAKSCGVLRDITESKRAEREMRDLSRRLIGAHEEERALLARELHDDISQRLAVLAIDAGHAELTTSDGEQVETMQTLREGLMGLSDDIHSLAYQLHPSVLEDLGLAEALRTECERRARQGQLSIAIDIDPLSPGVCMDTALCLFRVTQEALTNVANHARATVATVKLRQMDGGMLLAVSDNGVGFDAGGLGASGRHLGLLGMRERVQLAGGTFDIESAPDQGATVIAWVPAGRGDDDGNV